MRWASILIAVCLSLAATSVQGQTPQPTGCPRGDGGAVCLGAGGAPLDVAIVSDGTTYLRVTRAGVITLPNGATISGATFPFVFGSQAIGDLMYASTTTAFTRLAVGATAGMILRSTGTVPGWSTPTFPNAATTTGAYLRADGTNFIQSTLVLPNAATAGDLMTATAANTVGSVAAVGAGQVLTSAGTGTVPAYSANPSVTSVTGRLITSGAVTSVANVGADSCGTSAATIAGTDNAGIVTVGATAGTQCRVTFSAAAATRRLCIVNNETSANLARTTYVSTTTTDFLGTFVAGDVLAYVCIAR